MAALVFRLPSFAGAHLGRLGRAHGFASRVYGVVRGFHHGGTRCARPVRRRVARITLTTFAGWGDWLRRRAGGVGLGLGSKAKHTGNNQGG
jgi:hypothetical protein